MSDDKCLKTPEERAMEVGDILRDGVDDGDIADLRRQLKAEKAARKKDGQQRDKALAEILAWQQHTGEQTPYNAGMMMSDMRAAKETAERERDEAIPFMLAVKAAHNGYDPAARALGVFDEPATPAEAIAELLAEKDELFKAELDVVMQGRYERAAAAKALQQALDRTHEEVDRLKKRNEQLVLASSGNYWSWQGDAEDYPESLVCPILIGADAMRAILRQRNEAQAACAAMAPFPPLAATLGNALLGLSNIYWDGKRNERRHSPDPALAFLAESAWTRARAALEKCTSEGSHLGYDRLHDGRAIALRPNPGQPLLDEVAYLREHHDDCHQPAANYELLLDRLKGVPTNHGDCPVAAKLDALEAENERERDEAMAACAMIRAELEELVVIPGCVSEAILNLPLMLGRASLQKARAILHQPNPGQPLLDKLDALEAENERLREAAEAASDEKRDCQRLLDLEIAHAQDLEAENERERDEVQAACAAATRMIQDLVIAIVCHGTPHDKDRTGFKRVIDKEQAWRALPNPGQPLLDKCTALKAENKRLRGIVDRLFPQGDGYLIATFKHGYNGDNVVFWRPNQAGYTAILSRAGVYSAEETAGICRPGYDCVAVPASVIRSLAVAGINSECGGSRMELTEAAEAASEKETT